MMTRPISLLDQNTIDKIAAGEVVERPSSIVKELVENAIDAKATGITVEIKEGGISFIRITDNGSGIPKEQVPLAFLRHATSKLRSIEDLQQLVSLGFRGEALSSIAAVARVELITRTSDALTGLRYLIEGGVEKAKEEIGAPQGTTFLVRNLFYNTPARAKFLKSPTTEGSYVGSLLEQLALSHPEISFKYIQNGQIRLNTSGNGNFREVIYQIYGRDIARQLTEIDVLKQDLRITGFIGKPTVSRGNRNFENYYVNGRYVKNRILTKAIEDGYRSFLMQHKFPFTCLFLTIDTKCVDVNVHPSKMEVRFADADAVYQTVYRAVADALTEKELIPEVSFTPKAKQEKKAEAASPPRQNALPEPFEIKRQQRLREERSHYEDRPAVDVSEQTIAAAPEQAVQVSLFEDKKLLSENTRSLHRIIGQLFGTYWLVEMEEKLFIIDQHAAHEKVLYEKLMSELSQKQAIGQYLAVPAVVSLNLQQLELLRHHQSSFESLGFELEPFGEREYTIRAVPADLYGLVNEQLFTELLDRLETETNAQTAPEIFVEKLSRMACRAAVKGNQKLSPQEARALIDQLLELENPYHCPHGRPTIISMSRYELEKKFKRII